MVMNKSEESSNINRKIRCGEITVTKKKNTNKENTKTFYQVRVTIKTKLRKEPADDAAIMKELLPGVRLKVLDAQGGWLRVQTPEDDQGYVLFRELPDLHQALNDFLQPAPASVLDHMKLQEIYKAIDRLYNVSDEERKRHRQTLDSLVTKSTRELDLLIPSAYDYLRGDPNAEQRFLSILNFLVEREPPPPRPPSFKFEFQVRGDQDPSNPNTVKVKGIEAFLPPEPGQLGGDGCLFPPFLITRPYLAVLWIALSEGQPQDSRVQDIIWTYLWTVNRSLNKTESLELLYSAAQPVHAGDEISLQRFSATLDLVSDGGMELRTSQQPMPPSEQIEDSYRKHLGTLRSTSEAALPLPIADLSPPLVLDLCRLERAAMIGYALDCGVPMAYRITDIINLDRQHLDGSPYIREGCPGELVEIQGEGFRETRDWYPISGKSQVIFPGEGRDSIPVVEEDYVLWSDTRVQVRVPDGVRSGHLSMQIISDYTSGCGIRIKLHPTQENRSFEVPTPPIIEKFKVGYPERGQEWETRDIPACDTIFLIVEATNAEEAIILDNHGNRVDFPSGEPGDRRVIEGAVAVNSTESMIYTLRTSNACSTTERLVTVNRHFQFNWSDAYVTVRGGSTFELVLDHHCPPEAMSLEEAAFQITAQYWGSDGEYRNAHSFLNGLPDEVRFRHGETEKRFSITAADDICWTIVVTAHAIENSERYRESSSYTQVVLYDQPRITDVRTYNPNACDDFDIEITGDCFAPRNPLGSTHVSLYTTLPDGGREHWNIVTLLEIQYGSDHAHPWRDAVLIGRAIGPLENYSYSVRVTHSGLEGTAPLLRDGRSLNYPRSRIERFDASPPFILGGIGPTPPVTDVTLSWRVRYAAKVELHSQGGGLRSRDPGLLARWVRSSHQMCEMWEEEFRDRIQFAETYELRVFQFDTMGKPGTTGSTQTLHVSQEIIDETPPPTMLGVQRLLIYNCTWNRHRIYVWVWNYSSSAPRWENRGSLEPAYDSWGRCPAAGADSLDLTFDDGSIYDVRIIDPELRTCPDGRSDDPNLSNCWRERHIILGDSDGLGVTHHVM
jgi:hypothetical protein